VLASSRTFPDLGVTSTVRVNMGSAPFGWWKVKGTSRSVRGDHYLFFLGMPPTYAGP